MSDTYREANQCANVLANLRCSLDRNIVFYKMCPSQLNNLLLADIRKLSTRWFLCNFLFLGFSPIIIKIK
jgi:hypothetical protein